MNILLLILGIFIGCFITRLRRVQNKNADWNESKSYRVQWNPFNRPTKLALTDSQINKAGDRITNRPEDF